MNNEPNQLQQWYQPMSGAEPKGNRWWRLMAIILTVISSVIVAGALYGLFSSYMPVTQASGARAGRAYKVGQTAVVSAMEVTVNSVRTTQGGELDTLQLGHIFLVVDVTIKNRTGNDQYVSSLVDFSLRDSTGQLYTNAVLSEASTKTLDNEALADRAKVRGQLEYEVSKITKKFTLTYQPNFVHNGQATWDINI